MPSVSCSALSFRWPDGTPVFRGLDVALGPGRSGVVGANGAGKTTFLRLVAGDLRPAGGALRVDGTIGYLPQHLPLATGQRVDEVLGIADVRAALRDVESGLVDADRLDRIGDDWVVEERARATLDRLGLGGVGLDRTVGSLSGGETILLGLAARLLARPAVLLLDEPTNNLDLARRTLLHDAVDAFEGVLVVVSHDAALLERMERIVELRDGRAQVYGGNLAAYEQQVAQEQAAAARAVRAAKDDVRRQRRELAEARTALARRARAGRKAAAQHRLPKIVAGARKRAAQETAGRVRGVHEERLAAAQDRLETAEAAVRGADAVRIDLPATAVPARRTVLECTDLNVARGRGPAAAPSQLWRQAVAFSVRGPERLALLGPNGGGKTTLLACIAGELAPTGGRIDVRVAGVGYLPQRLDILDARASILDNLRRHAPAADEHTLRARLARFGFRAGLVDQPAAILSGGERFRAALAVLLCAEPPPQLLLLDEPTNNLDLQTRAQLRQALGGFHGAVLIASHDLAFLRALDITRWLALDADGLAEIGAPD
jgi:ATPase subunit of ABC transporter with duplicated ATPase domains